MTEPAAASAAPAVGQRTAPGATTADEPCGVTAVISTATPTASSPSTTAAPAPTRQRARRASGTGEAFTPSR